MSLIEFMTEDKKVMKVDERIVNFSELFKTLNENFETDTGKPLTGIKEKEMNLLVEFCEACDYNQINFEKPIWKKTFKKNYDEKIAKNEKLVKFYNELNCEKLCTYLKISYFYDCVALKEFLYFKLYDVFEDENKSKEYFKEKDNDIIEEILKIDDEKQNILYNHYQEFIRKQIQFLTPEEINDYCLLY